MTLKQFKGPKPASVVRLQCLELGLTFGMRGDSDYVRIDTPAAPLAVVFYNDINGRFFGTDDTGVMFNSSNPLDGTPWFDALLEFFLEPQPTSHDVPAGEGYTHKLHGSMS